jgi:hypothetical protein
MSFAASLAPALPEDATGAALAGRVGRPDMCEAHGFGAPMRDPAKYGMLR